MKKSEESLKDIGDMTEELIYALWESQKRKERGRELM